MSPFLFRKFLLIIFFTIPLISLFENINRYLKLNSISSELKIKLEKISEVKKLSTEMHIIKRSLNFMKKFKKLPTIYIISSVDVNNLNQIADLTRTLNTLRLVPKINWIVIENASQKSRKIKHFLYSSNLSYIHLKYKIKSDLYNEHYDYAINWIRNMGDIDKNAIVYFVKTQSSFNLDLFEEMRYTTTVMVWPVALINNSLYYRPVCNNKTVIGWYCSKGIINKKYTINLSGFAINVKLLFENRNIYLRNYAEDNSLALEFIKTLIDKKNKIQVADCKKINVRDSETMKPKIDFKKAYYDKDMLDFV